MAEAPDNTKVHILLVEDSVPDATLLQRSIADSSWSQRAEVFHCKTLAEACEQLAQGDYDCVLLDLGLPDARGTGNIETILEADPDATIVVLTGNDNDSAAMEALKLGAQEYAIKGMYEGEGLVRILRHAMERNRMAVELKALREREWFLATHDNLTQLPNRQLFNDRAEQALAQAKRKSGQIAFCFLDLDGFKPINDNHGHAVGDELLRRVARILDEAVRDTDTVARLGGDEFVLLLSPLQSADQALQVSERVISHLSAISEIEGNQISLGASIGISLYPEHGEGLDVLLRHADAAMYLSKRSGRGRVSFYSPEMGEVSDS